MASNIVPANVDGTYPKAGQDNTSQGFRDNFSAIKNNFTEAVSEIEDLQTNKASTNANVNFSDNVKGKGLPAATNNVKSIIYGKEIEGGIGPKISDFIDAGLDKNSRSWMGGSSTGGQPFVVDVHTARDTGLVDQTYLNHLEKLGYIIPEDIKIDFGQGGITGTKYENRALFGQGLTKYLNETKWIHRS